MTNVKLYKKNNFILRKNKKKCLQNKYKTTAPTRLAG